MTDLSHWHFAEHFSGFDAAALILGLEPRESENDEWRVRVVAERMELHYDHAYKRFLFEIDSPPDKQSAPVTSRAIELISVEMDQLHRLWWIDGYEAPFSGWLFDRRLPVFENQVFSRTAIVHWLAAIGGKSIYPFNRDLIYEVSNVTTSGRWPWGSHHTEMLGHLEAAAVRFWINYDPEDATTAKTNAKVSEWLQTDRKVSRTMADSIASMLRADGIPTGPRK